MKETQNLQFNTLQTGNWSYGDVDYILENLEKPNWAPWLAAGHDSLEGRISTFPEGQITLYNNDSIPVATVSTNRINWSGNVSDLPTWDVVAGDPTTYENTYVPEGNTIALMSANVDPNFQGKGLAKHLISAVLATSKQLGGIDYVIGSFRPTGFGIYQHANSPRVINFEEYCYLSADMDAIKSIDSKIDWSPWKGNAPPFDPWLRNLARNGMIPLAVDHSAMEVVITKEEFVYYSTNYKPDGWVQIEDGSWLCSEVGRFWEQNDGSYIYLESNLWGTFKL